MVVMVKMVRKVTQVVVVRKVIQDAMVNKDLQDLLAMVSSDLLDLKDLLDLLDLQVSPVLRWMFKLPRAVTLNA
jgi:hypothetical protein